MSYHNTVHARYGYDKSVLSAWGTVAKKQFNRERPRANKEKRIGVPGGLMCKISKKQFKRERPRANKDKRIGVPGGLV